jgi:hypothetical protein
MAHEVSRIGRDTKKKEGEAHSGGEGEVVQAESARAEALELPHGRVHPPHTHRFHDLVLYTTTLHSLHVWPAMMAHPMPVTAAPGCPRPVSPPVVWAAFVGVWGWLISRPSFRRWCFGASRGLNHVVQGA